MYSVIRIFFLSCLLLVGGFPVYASINSSPVVQIISYTDIFGNYPQMLGWGSASIIDKKGRILTNNHVVDDGDGNVVSAFSVCITTSSSSKPLCNYTASLIARDADMDLALLQIDPVDIFGKSVDFSQLQTIDIDYGYVPVAQDSVVAVGYPWVGADTITETKGIVAGVQSYNGYSYIKTDALIAGGNSGGPLIKDGKLVGVNTFGIGGMFDPTLGYALRIGDARSFIQSSIDLPPQKSFLDVDFVSYRSMLDSINEQNKLSDDLIQFSIPSSYEVLNYISHRHIEIVNKEQKDTLLTNVTIDFLGTPKLASQTDFFWYLEQNGFYNKDRQKLVTKTIGGMTFYYPVAKNDVSEGSYTSVKQYVAQRGDRGMIAIVAQGSFYDTVKGDRVAQEFDTMMNGIQFSSSVSPAILQTDFSLKRPSLFVPTNRLSIVDPLQGYMAMYLGNLYNVLRIYVQKKGIYDGKGQDPDAMFEAQTSEISAADKRQIMFLGYPGYMFCIKQNPLDNYMFEETVVDQKGTERKMGYCKINIFYTDAFDEQEYDITLDLHVEDKLLERYFSIAQLLMQKLVRIPEQGDGETKFDDIFGSKTKLLFADIENQADGFRNVLRYFVENNLLENTTRFDGTHALRRDEFIYNYTRSVYPLDYTQAYAKCKKDDFACYFANVYVVVQDTKENIQTILGRLLVDSRAYVNRSQIDTFESAWQLLLAGIDVQKLSEEKINDFQQMMQEKQYADWTQKINELEYSWFGSKRITFFEINIPTESWYYQGTITYSPVAGLKEHLWYSQGPLRFGTVTTDSQVQTCLRSSTLTTKACQTYLREQLLDETRYEVLTKGEMINRLMYKVDRAQFDLSLQAKKDTVVR